MNKAWVLLLCVAMAALAAAQTEKPSAARTRDKTPAVAAERPDLAAISPAASSVEPMAALPAGTTVTMKLETPISTRTNKAGDRFSGRVTEAVTLNGRTIIPVGAALEGKIARADERRRIRGTPTIDLRPETVIMPSGDRYALNAVIVDTDARPEVEVNDEGKLKGRGHDRRDWEQTGIASGAGAITGGVIAGGHGALIGAGVGATASAVHWLWKRRSAELPAGTEIIMELSRPMSLGASGTGQ
ncbi:MAG: hypothetical protein LAN64_15530 [Acidobacteriia bacterium]|nr:hypothetical protein [Terriglobia bacterium]